MNFASYAKQFRAKASKSGFSEDETIACLAYAKPLIEQNLPVIFNTANLSALVGYKTTYLKKAVRFPTYFYRTFTINKRSGKPRQLAEPLPSLKEILNWILENLLNEIPVSKYAKAYIKQKTIIENVKYHKGKEAVLTLDILNFFGSIKMTNVEVIFRDLGYSSNISNLLAKLCTFEGSLPQGAPTSPYLSNLYLRGFDETVSTYCNERNIRYTRYADDLTFSGKKNDLDIVDFIQSQLIKYDLVLNTKKQKLMERNERQIVTGIVVNKKLQIPKSDRNFIRNEVHFLTKFGLKEHLQRTKNKKTNYIDHLLGKINFALHINPDNVKMQKVKIEVIKFLQEIDDLGETS